MTGIHELKNVKMYLSLVRKYHNPLEIKSIIYISFQGRQKLARFNAREFTTLVIDILSDAKRRQTGALSPSQTRKELGKEIINITGALSPSQTPKELGKEIINIYMEDGSKIQRNLVLLDSTGQWLSPLSLAFIGKYVV